MANREGSPIRWSNQASLKFRAHNNSPDRQLEEFTRYGPNGAYASPSSGPLPAAVVPWPLFAVIAASTLLMAGVVGLALGRRTTSVSPAMEIRTE